MVQKLFFEKYEEPDFDTYYSLVKEDEVMQFISGKGLTEEQAGIKFNSILALNRAEGALGYFKVYSEGKMFIGDCKLVHYPKDKSLLEIGYILKKEFWGIGYGKRIVREMLDLAAQTFPLNNIIGLIDPGNTASKKLLEKFDFRTCFLGIEDELPTEKLMLEKC